jgi:hypothetical protein
VLFPRGLVCLVRSIIHVCTCTIQPTLFAAVGSAVLFGHGVLFHVQGLAVHPWGSRFFTLPHGCVTLPSVIDMATSLSTCLLAPFIGLLPFALLLFTWCSRLSCVLSSQHFFWLFTSSLIIQCSNGLYLITRPNSTTIRLHNFRDSATLALRLVSPARWYTLRRFFWSLGSALVSFCQGLQVSPAFKGPRFPFAVACNLSPYLAT